MSILPGRCELEVDAREEDCEEDAVLVEHAARDSVVRHLEQVLRDDGQALRVVLLVLQVGVLRENGAENLEEELQRELVQEVHLQQTQHHVKMTSEGRPHIEEYMYMYMVRGVTWLRASSVK